MRLTLGALHRVMRIRVTFNYFFIDLLEFICKLDLFININNYGCFAMKRSSLQERVSYFTPKGFMGLTHGQALNYRMKAGQGFNSRFELARVVHRNHTQQHNSLAY
jgi:hypothetical protein